MKLSFQQFIIRMRARVIYICGIHHQELILVLIGEGYLRCAIIIVYYSHLIVFLFFILVMSILVTGNY